MTFEITISNTTIISNEQTLVIAIIVHKNKQFVWRHIINYRKRI